MIKPPLGIEPRYIWLEKRIVALRHAIGRQYLREDFEDKDYTLIYAWFAELIANAREIEAITGKRTGPEAIRTDVQLRDLWPPEIMTYRGGKKDEKL